MNQKIQPISDNIIFYDSEFTSLDPYKGELLSVGMVKMSGEELYVEIEHSDSVSDWVKENVLPKLTGNPVSREDAKQQIVEFLGYSQPHLMAFVVHYDMVYLHKLFGADDVQQKSLPYFWMPLDFATVLFANGIDPKLYMHDNKDFFESLDIDTSKYDKHNALDDARMLRDTYLKLIR